VHSWEEKVKPALLSKLQTTDTAEYLILLKQNPLDTTNVPPLDRPTYVFKTLTAETARSQAPLIEYLTKAKVPFKSYWIANVIITTTNLTLLTEIAQRDEGHLLEENKPFKVNLETPEFIEDRNETLKRQARVEWNVNYVRASDVWATYNLRGQGFTVANADTGVQWDHPALRNQYRGYSSGVANHNYNWWDAVHQDEPNCGADSQEPCDDNGHGTHTTGTAVGYDPVANYYIGMAPAAKWIACRNMRAGFGIPQTYIECLQFFVAPTDLTGQNPDPLRAPHVIGNSYGCTPDEGCDVDSLSEAVANVLAAGIFMSVSAGNSGPSCASIYDPPATDTNVCSVGALQYQSSVIASFSSRGPIKGSTVGPTVVAPGSNVRSSYPTNSYASLSGTSMASPAVTGIIPLLWQGKTNLVRNIPQTILALRNSASPIDSTQCQSSGRPNNVYGSGLINIYLALEQS